MKTQAELDNYIDSIVKANSTKAITGDILGAVLKQITDSMRYKLSPVPDVYSFTIQPEMLDVNYEYEIVHGLNTLNVVTFVTRANKPIGEAFFTTENTGVNTTKIKFYGVLESIPANQQVYILKLMDTIETYGSDIIRNGGFTDGVSTPNSWYLRNNATWLDNNKIKLAGTVLAWSGVKQMNMLVNLARYDKIKIVFDVVSAKTNGSTTIQVALDNIDVTAIVATPGTKTIIYTIQNNVSSFANDIDIRALNTSELIIDNVRCYKKIS